MRFFRFLFIALAMLLANTSCKKADIAQKPPPPIPPDPCDSTRIGTKYTTANFLILETIGGQKGKNIWVDYETDTFASGYLIFEANLVDDSVSYTWYIGAGVYNTRRVSLTFVDVVSGQRIYAKLVVRSIRKKKLCDNDDGVDSLTKSVVYFDGSSIPSKGKFFMKNQELPYNSDTLEYDFNSYNVHGDSTDRHRGKIKVPTFKCWSYDNDGSNGSYGYRQGSGYLNNDNSCFGTYFYFMQMNDTFFLYYSKNLDRNHTTSAEGYYFYTPFR